MPFILDLILFRSLTLYILYEPISLLNLFRGYLSDILQCLPFIILYNVSNNKYGKFILFILFSLLIAANTEHIIVNKGNITYESILFIKDEQFISGSALSFRAILLFISSCSLLILLRSSSPYLFAAFEKLPHQIKVRKPVMFLTAFTLTAITPISVFNSSWQQQSFLEQNISSYIHSLTNRNKKHYISDWSYSGINDIKTKNAQYHVLNPYEVNNGTSFLNELKPEKNVLLILVEGLSQHQIVDNTLKHIQQLGEVNFSAHRFITAQRQTNRGLYALFCGKYSNLISKVAKADVIGTLGPDTLCLPEILKRNGYETVFLQSADLAFMRKDLFSQQIGFNQTHGNPAWIKPRIKTAWGIDDLTLYDSAIYKIAELNRQHKKWFMSLLTVSTHHPYNFPGAPALPSYQDALVFADQAVAAFIKKLNENKILDDTLVIVMSDEANGTGDIGFGKPETPNSNFLSDNHGPFIALGKRISKKTSQDQVFSQVDVPATILDYLQIDNPKPIGGRSLFRTYKNEKKVFFANVYRDLFGYFEGPEKMILCSLNLNCSTMKLGKNAFSNNTFQYSNQATVDAKESAFIKKVIDINDIYTSHFKGTALFSEKDKTYQGKSIYEIVRNFKVMGKQGTPLEIKIHIDNSVSEASKQLTLVIATVSDSDKKINASEITINPGQLTSVTKPIFLTPNEYYWLDIYVKSVNEEKWNANLIQIH